MTERGDKVDAQSKELFDLTLPLDQAEGCRAMDERRAIKTLLRQQGACAS